MRQSFGYDTGCSTAVNSHGKNKADHYRDLAHKVPIEHPSGQWTGDKKVYGEVIKNRITTINKKYNTYRNMLSQTGQGLIDGGRDHEIEDGTELANIWDKIRLEFPFYKTLNSLMGRSPTVDCEASKNSGSDMDLLVLGNRGMGRQTRLRALSQSTDVSSAYGDNVPPPSEADTDQLDQEDDEDLELPDSEEDIPIEAANKSKPANHDRTTNQQTSVPPLQIPQRPSLQINECIQFEREHTRLAMRELELVEESKWKAEELMEETKRREAERKHEMAMLEKRLEYELCMKQLLAGTTPQTSRPWDSFSLTQSSTDPFSGIPNLDEYK
ncbi:hypothetical protein M422DRAFT_269503 [Sphaerobolus stellatus SS14]|uniref:Uncharacterized protein n=1 Tax=Sphaerobolus stellatus (strain SS14) TaxID=990650 RepID=A0A0C9U4H2_SPHS4|nr:hypothetical protein M422DRAFT_269503 [Sphaerobolus stellatus SS14]